MKKTPYLKLVVNNGKLIDEAFELAQIQMKLIKQKQTVQANITLLNLKNEELGTTITKLEKEIDKLERKVNGTTKRTTGRDNNINGT